jgi:hypothetical protein
MFTSVIKVKACAGSEGNLYGSHHVVFVIEQSSGVIPELSTDYYCSTTTLNPILACNL